MLTLTEAELLIVYNCLRELEECGPFRQGEKELLERVYKMLLSRGAVLTCEFKKKGEKDV